MPNLSYSPLKFTYVESSKVSIEFNVEENKTTNINIYTLEGSIDNIASVEIPNNVMIFIADWIKENAK